MNYRILFKNLVLQLQKLSVVVFILLLFVPITSNAQTNNFIPSTETICGGSCPLIDGNFNASVEGIATFILSIARFLTFIGGALSALFIVYGGLLILTDFGGGKRAEAGWNCIKSSLIGLVIVIVAYTVVGFIGNFLLSANLGTILSNT